MAQKSYFFNSAPGDRRTYQAADFARYFGSVLTSGIMPNPETGDIAALTPGEYGLNTRMYANLALGLQVVMGNAIIRGYRYELDSPHDITFRPQSSVDVGYDRIDRIVLRLDLSNHKRSIELAVVEGNTAINPVPPALTRNYNVYELSLARVRVRAGYSYIDESDVVDERADETVCGFANSLITVPTSVFQQQFDSWFDSYKQTHQTDAENWLDDLKAQISQDTEIFVQQEILENSNTIAGQLMQKADEAVYKAANAVNTANGIDGKATEALSKSNTAKDTAEYVQSQLDNVVADGDSLAEVVQARAEFVNLRDRLDTEFGAVTAQLAQTDEALLRRGIDPILFGADPTGTQDSTSAFQAASLYGLYLDVPAGTYLISNWDTLDKIVIAGKGKTQTVFKKGADGYVLDLGRHGVIMDIGFDGDKANYTGETIRITKGENSPVRANQGHQRLIRCAFDNADGYHVHYTQPNKGWMSRLHECDFGLTNADAAVKYPDETTNGGNRYIYDSYSAKPIVNLGGCDNAIIAFNTVGGGGGDEEGIIFPASINGTKKVIVTGNRFAIANGTLKIRGIDHVFNDNIIAGNVHLTPDAAGCRWGVGNKLNGTFTNERVSNEIFGVSGSYIPEWTASTVNPEYGNASIQAFWRWEGKKICVSIQITFGSTTTFGKGAWSFSLPFVLSGMPSKSFTGTALTSKGNTGILLGTPSNGKVTIYRTGDTISVFNSSTPHTWASGDYLLMDFEYSLLS